jgi:hypothetical protein
MRQWNLGESLRASREVPTRLLSVALLLASQEAVRPAEARLRMRPAALSHEARRLATSASLGNII